MRSDSCPYVTPWATKSEESIWAYLLENSSISREMKYEIASIGILWGNTRMPLISGDTMEGILVLNNFKEIKVTCPVNTSNLNLDGSVGIDEVLKNNGKS